MHLSIVLAHRMLSIDLSNTKYIHKGPHAMHTVPHLSTSELLCHDSVIYNGMNKFATHCWESKTDKEFHLCVTESFVRECLEFQGAGHKVSACGEHADAGPSEKQHTASDKTTADEYTAVQSLVDLSGM